MWQRNATVFAFICVLQASGSYNNFEICSVACSFQDEINRLIRWKMLNAICFDILKISKEELKNLFGSSLQTQTFASASSSAK